VIFVSANAKREDDVVVLKNGDRMTGKVDGLRQGELKFKADYMAEAVRLDWSEVERLDSKDQYLIYLTNGTLYTDFLRLVSSTGNSDENFFIGLNSNARRVRQLEVLRILPVEARFWRQLEGYVDFGFSYTSGNDQYETELNSGVTYRRGKHTLSATVDTLFNGQEDGDSTRRKQFTFDYIRQLTPRTFAGGLFDLLSSDEQSLDRRTTVGGIIGRHVLQTERTRLSIFGGLAGTREKYSVPTGEDLGTNADAIAGADFTTFRFTTTDVRARLLVFPSLTVPGRVRIQATSDMRIKIASDLYWGFHLYQNFDSKPPLATDKNDLGVSTSIGWKF
jgi:putative salt-induced outer membrane protein YdiY